MVFLGAATAALTQRLLTTLLQLPSFGSLALSPGMGAVLIVCGAAATMGLLFGPAPLMAAAFAAEEIGRAHV